MTEQENTTVVEKKMPLKQAAVVTLGVLIIIAVVVVTTSLLKLSMWIPFLGFTVWSATGMSFELKAILKVWLGAAMALLIGFLMSWAPAQLGPAGIAIPLILIVIMIFCMIASRLTLIFNISCGMFMVVTTSIGAITSLNSYFDWLYGFVVLGLIPFAIVTLLKKKSTPNEKQED